MAAWPVPEEVTVVRKKKEKALQVADYLVGRPRLVEDGRAVEFSLVAKPTGSLRPDKLVAACLAQLPEGERPALVALTRVSQADEAGRAL